MSRKKFRQAPQGSQRPGAKRGRRAKDALNALAVTPSKERGQNFIISPFVVEQIVQFGAPRAHEQLVEIGPGLGALTAALYGIAPLSVVEIEPRFCAELLQRFPKLKIINEDVRKVDFSTLGENLTVFGNLPYSFSTEIIFHLLRHRAVIERAVLLLQREFAERVAADPGSKTYGSLSVAVQLWAEPRLGPLIAGDVFHPPTKVDSMLLELQMRSQPVVEVSDPELLERVVRAAFLRRRQQIFNSMRGAGRWSDLELKSGLERAGVSPESRAEELSIQDFARLCQALHPHSGN